MTRKQIAGKMFFEETITVDNHPNILTEIIALLVSNERDCWFQQGCATFILRKQTVFLQEFFGDLLSGAEFGHYDLQTSRHLNYFSGDFLNKEPTAIPQGD